MFTAKEIGSVIQRGGDVVSASKRRLVKAGLVLDVGKGKLRAVPKVTA